ncbi:MAG: hypothetical protein OEZ04_12760 [Nitrospinota bacterium]|nr:hypothetical protein [Nitrospinota bacterium]
MMISPEDPHSKAASVKRLLAGMGPLVFLFVIASQAIAYPGVLVDGKPGCSGCHDSQEFSPALNIRFLSQQEGRTVDNFIKGPDRIVAVMRKGGKAAFKLVLRDEGGGADVAGWQWVAPAGVEVDVPGGVRRLGAGQPWDRYEENGRMVKSSSMTVVSQRFYFSPRIPGTEAKGVLLVAIGKEMKGPGALSWKRIEVLFKEAQ